MCKTNHIRKGKEGKCCIVFRVVFHLEILSKTAYFLLDVQKNYIFCQLAKGTKQGKNVVFILLYVYISGKPTFTVILFAIHIIYRKNQNVFLYHLMWNLWQNTKLIFLNESWKKKNVYYETRFLADFWVCYLSYLLYMRLDF